MLDIPARVHVRNLADSSRVFLDVVGSFRVLPHRFGSLQGRVYQLELELQQSAGVQPSVACNLPVLPVDFASIFE